MVKTIFKKKWSYDIGGGLPWSVKVFSSVSHSTGHAETLPYRTSGQVHELMLLQWKQHTHKWTRTTLALCSFFPRFGTYVGWVALHGGVNMTQTEQLRLLQKARFHPHGIESWSCMALKEREQAWLSLILPAKHPNARARGQRCPHLRHDEAVIVEVPWIVVAILHGVEKQHRHDLCHTAAWCWVSGNRNIQNRVKSSSFSWNIFRVFKDLRSCTNPTSNLSTKWLFFNIYKILNA